MTIDEPSGLMAPVEKVDEAVSALSRQRRVEFVLVVVATVAALMAVGFSAWSAAQIRSCTTPAGRCYRDTTVRARSASRAQQNELNRQHKVIQCVLLVDPTERDERILQACEEKHK